MANVTATSTKRRLFSSEDATSGGDDDDDVVAVSRVHKHREIMVTPSLTVPIFSCFHHHESSVKYQIKINLGVPAFGTVNGKPLVLNVVKRAEKLLLNHSSFHTEDVPITSWKDFNEHSAKLIFGSNSHVFLWNTVATVQCLSGTSSLWYGVQFLIKYYHMPVIYIPQLSWVNHKSIFSVAGLSVETYRYEHPQKHDLDFQGLLEDIRSASPRAIVFFHACGHNPKGLYPTLEQWKQIKGIMELKAMIPFFDTSYQGFASGRLNEDARSVRMFAGIGDLCLVAQSYSESMGFHDEPIGALNIVCKTNKFARWVESRFERMISPMYSNLRLASIANTILTDSELFKEWTTELKDMADHITSMRQKLYCALRMRGTPGDWSQVVNQTGLFTYTGLSAKQIAVMTEEYHIYMTYDGRINMAGLNMESLDYLVDAMHAAVIRI